MDNQRKSYLEQVVGSEVRRFQLTPDAVCRIGRNDDNTLVLADNQVSRHHAMVEEAAGHVYLTDLGSRNGTFVNRQRVTGRIRLRPCDSISIGGQEMVFQGPIEPAVTSAQGPGETIVSFSEQLITVLVADIRDFTGLSSRLPEAKLSALISTFNREAGAVLTQQGAWGQKYIGDAVMAIWKHPGTEPGPRDLLAVFLSAYRIFQLAAQLQPELGLDSPIRIGAGINSGIASLGNMGSDASADYTALSDAVNLSFRLESATKEIGCDLAVGQATYEFLRKCCDPPGVFEPRTVLLKGYGKPKTIYTITGDPLDALIQHLSRNVVPREISTMETAEHSVNP